VGGSKAEESVHEIRTLGGDDGDLGRPYGFVAGWEVRVAGGEEVVQES
jgi:hypothetical protein